MTVEGQVEAGHGSLGTSRAAVTHTRLQTKLVTLTRTFDYTGDIKAAAAERRVLTTVQQLISQPTTPQAMSALQRGYLLFIDSGSRGNSKLGGAGTLLVKLGETSHTGHVIWRPAWRTGAEQPRTTYRSTGVVWRARPPVRCGKAARPSPHHGCLSIDPKLSPTRQAYQGATPTNAVRASAESGDTSGYMDAPLLCPHLDGGCRGKYHDGHNE